MRVTFCLFPRSLDGILTLMLPGSLENLAGGEVQRAPFGADGIARCSPRLPAGVRW